MPASVAWVFSLKFILNKHRTLHSITWPCIHSHSFANYCTTLHTNTQLCTSPSHSHIHHLPALHTITHSCILSHNLPQHHTALHIKTITQWCILSQCLMIFMCKAVFCCIVYVMVCFCSNFLLIFTDVFLFYTSIFVMRIL